MLLIDSEWPSVLPGVIFQSNVPSPTISVCHPVGESSPSSNDGFGARLAGEAFADLPLSVCCSPLPGNEHTKSIAADSVINPSVLYFLFIAITYLDKNLREISFLLR